MRSISIFSSFQLLLVFTLFISNSTAAAPTVLESLASTINLATNLAAKKNSDNATKYDPCAAIAGKSTASFNDAKACLDFFKYDKDIAKQTLDTVRKITNDLYVFNELAKNPPQVEGLGITPIDISHGLDLIEKENWKSDREFQEAIALLLDKVEDAHLSYSPFCYRQFIFWQPIQLNALLRNQRLVINVAYVKDDIWPDADSSWVGCEVVQIDGIEAMEMVVNYAVNNNGESKDVNTCFNNIMNTKSYFHGWDDGADDLGYHRFLPAQEYHNYTLKCPQKGTLPKQEEYDEPFTVVVPWVAQVPPSYTSAESYWKNFCESSHYSKGNVTKRDIHYDLHELKAIHEGDVFALNANTNAAAAGENKHGRYIEFIQLDKPNDKVGVIDIQSFSIAAEDREAFVQNVTTGLRTFEKDGVEKIILDLSSNGGGDACAGEFLINTFFNSTPDYPSDIKYSPLLERVVKKAYEQQNTKWLDYKPLHNDSSRGSEWFTDTHTYARGNDKNVRFSQPVSLSCAGWGGLTSPDNNKNGNNTFVNNKWKPSDVVILSDGRCGSTCAIVASRLHLSHQVPAMGLGGIRGNRMQFASFPGGESDRLSSFLMDLEILGLSTDADAPLPFPERADIGWTFREVYKPTKEFTGQETDLLEYSVINADCRLYFDDDNADDVKRLWADAAKVLLAGQCLYIEQ
ncbi:hypothetical protein BDF20DRAFT_905218 [Mycotypha africana]|uniref:uncharacterized protein n=1 Tax=Mycotypha africana TaxID=64632 RepID=UPI0022FFE915|nr:uncharacterized protein BDF20DRAFT_905218 [Mycotypha africana]KAI8984165.1 hypothetical protein BDF20DRAFT_905218 [Mycotypha africana]